ncbi:hypothetical protein LI291_03310 [Intestinibacillus massiliensis]|nr:hypothetical protein [Intestinibacillus massiliensis]
MKRSLLLLPLLLLLAGCGDARETSVLSPVSAAALSGDATGLHLTVETVWQDSAEGKATPQYLTAEAATIPNLFAAAANNVGGEFYFSHAQVFLVDEAAARQGLLPLAEYLCDENDARLSIRLAVARGATADEVLRAWAPSGEIPGIALGRMLSEGEKRGSGVDMPLFRFLNLLLSGPDVHTALPAVTVGTDGQAVPSGLALFEGDRLTGFTDGGDPHA